MIYTRDKPKLVKSYYFFKNRSTFTGVVKDIDGNIAYYVNGKFNRTDGPAIEYTNGDKQWHLNGKFHKEDGPAIEYSEGSKQWWLNGKCHREDGPAIQSINGSKIWYLNDECYGYDDDYTNESWIRFIQLELLK